MQRRALLEKHPWLTFLLPLLVFMLVGTLEPTPDAVGGKAVGLAIPYACYPLVYTVKIALTVAAIFFVLPGYLAFALRIRPMALVVGVLGVVAWIELCHLDLEQRFLVPLLKWVWLDWLVDLGTRSGYDPLEHLAGRPVCAWGFLVIRFLGLAAVVPLIEEFFLRGFLMRFVVGSRWWEIPMGKANGWAIVLATLVPMAMHPAELLAAAVWFSMVTWLYLKTQNIWDCVTAHAVTNLLLGVYVVTTGHWQLM
ncbi:MAG: CAAX prenyl protease-related protein [Planctomycetes bacterium RBG_13_63_9]|nr:MAG: CAAX prenyl protease-related protein [Planctomycetes bacterium RBG_13_63_9]